MYRVKIEAEMGAMPEQARGLQKLASKPPPAGERGWDRLLQPPGEPSWPGQTFASRPRREEISGCCKSTQPGALVTQPRQMDTDPGSHSGWEPCSWVVGQAAQGQLHGPPSWQRAAFSRTKLLTASRRLGQKRQPMLDFPPAGRHWPAQHPGATPDPGCSTVTGDNTQGHT